MGQVKPIGNPAHNPTEIKMTNSYDRWGLSPIKLKTTFSIIVILSIQTTRHGHNE